MLLTYWPADIAGDPIAVTSIITAFAAPVRSTFVIATAPDGVAGYIR